MNCLETVDAIVMWLKSQKDVSGQKGFVVGISGGIDSAVASTLCARTGIPTLCVTIPILQPVEHHDRAHEHLKWLMEHYSNVSTFEVDLSQMFLDFKETLPGEARGDLALANCRSRLRMVALYALAKVVCDLVSRDL